MLARSRMSVQILWAEAPKEASRATQSVSTCYLPLKISIFSRLSVWVFDLAGVSLSSDHVTAGEASLCSDQLVELLDLRVKVMTIVMNPNSTSSTFSWSPSKSWRKEAWVPVVPFTPRNLCKEVKLATDSFSREIIPWKKVKSTSEPERFSGCSEIWLIHDQLLRPKLKFKSSIWRIRILSVRKNVEPGAKELPACRQWSAAPAGGGWSQDRGRLLAPDVSNFTLRFTFNYHTGCFFTGTPLKS